MGAVYATVSDMRACGVKLSAEQEETAENLLVTASAKLRVIAHGRHKDLDSLVANEDYAEAVKSIVIQAVARSLNSISDDIALSQQSQSGLGYSVSMTYINAGQSLYFLKNELRELGLMGQTYGALEVYETTD